MVGICGVDSPTKSFDAAAAEVVGQSPQTVLPKEEFQPVVVACFPDALEIRLQDFDGVYPILAGLEQPRHDGLLVFHAFEDYSMYSNFG